MPSTWTLTWRLTDWTDWFHGWTVLGGRGGESFSFTFSSALLTGLFALCAGCYGKVDKQTDRLADRQMAFMIYMTPLFLFFFTLFFLLCVAGEREAGKRKGWAGQGFFFFFLFFFAHIHMLLA